MTGETPISEALIESFLAEVATRRDELMQRVQACAPAGRSVQILAVSKGQPVEAVIAAQRLGITSFGENYAAELRTKAAVLDSLGISVDWHFIGQLQSNKVRLVADAVAVWQSVDRARLVNEIARRAPAARIMVQVNLSGAENRPGCTLDEAPALVGEADHAGLHVVGLMGVGSEGDPERNRVEFDLLRGRCDELDLATCSMGMSADLELAVAAGSDMIRVGSALFGPRT